MMVRCGGMYKEQTLQGFLEKVIDLRTCRTMRCWYVNNREATLGELAHQACSVLNLRGAKWKAAERDGRRTEVVGHNTNGTKAREKRTPHYGSPRRRYAFLISKERRFVTEVVGESSESRGVSAFEQEV